ncbi:hypothetical protein BH09ACT12_BH09ACT12_34380 [soil metagenome]
MGLLRDLMGRSRPVQANLDALFGVPSAAIALQTTIGLVPTGDGAVCYRAPAGSGFAQAQADMVELLESATDGPEIRVTQDDFGYSWLEVDHEPYDPIAGDLGGLCTDLHAVNTTLEAAGFGPSLLCSLIPFVDGDGRSVGLVYLYKQGTFYPFAPVVGGARERDNLLELQIRDALDGELRVESDLSRWLALWGAPGL